MTAAAGNGRPVAPAAGAGAGSGLAAATRSAAVGCLVAVHDPVPGGTGCPDTAFGQCVTADRDISPSQGNGNERG